MSDSTSTTGARPHRSAQRLILMGLAVAAMAIGGTSTATISRAAEPVLAGRAMLLADDLADSHGGLPSAVEGSGRTGFVPEGYIVATSFGFTSTAGLYPWFADDLAFTGDVYLLRGGNDVSAGLVFRDDGAGGYYFGIDPFNWTLLRYRGPWQGPTESEKLVMIATGKLPAVTPASNHRVLGVVVGGSNLQLFVNDQAVWDGTDPNPDPPIAGRFGFRTILWATDGATAGFKNARVATAAVGGCGLLARVGSGSLLVQGAGYGPGAQVAISATMSDQTVNLTAGADDQGVLRAELSPPTNTDLLSGSRISASAGSCTAQAVVSPASARLIFEDGFEDDQHQWGGGSEDSCHEFACVRGGQLHLQPPPDGGRVSWPDAPALELGDFDYRAVITRQGGAATAGAGIQFRRHGHAETAEYYGFTITLRSFHLTKRQDGQVTELVPWQASHVLRPDGAPNVLRVVTRGPEISLYINGWSVARVSDGALSSGNIAVTTSGGVQLAIDDVRVTTVSSAAE